MMPDSSGDHPESAQTAGNHLCCLYPNSSIIFHCIFVAKNDKEGSGQSSVMSSLFVFHPLLLPRAKTQTPHKVSLSSITSYKNPITLWTPNTSKYTITLIHTILHSSLNTINSTVFQVLYTVLSVRKKSFALVFLKYRFDLAYAKDPAGVMLNNINSTEEQQFCWNPEHLGLNPNEAKILPGDSEVMEGQEAEQLLWHMQDLLCPPLSAALAASPEHLGRASGKLWDSTAPPTCAERNRELCHCLTEPAASSFYT